MSSTRVAANVSRLEHGMLVRVLEHHPSILARGRTLKVYAESAVTPGRWILWEFDRQPAWDCVKARPDEVRVLKLTGRQREALWPIVQGAHRP